MEDILMKDMVFIAEHKESGTRVEFKVEDLEGVENVYLDDGNYAERLPDVDYIYRLKRKDEKEEGLIRPREIVSAEALKDEHMLVTYSNGETLEYDLEELIANERKYGREFDYRDFEWYYGVRECQETLEKINLNQPLFYIIAIKEKYLSEDIGYIGYTWKEDVLNLELYIYQDHRRKGYAKEAVRALFAEAFERRLRIYTREDGRMTIQPRMVTATVRMDNNASRRLMESCGFQLEDGLELPIPQEGYELEEPLRTLSYTITAERRMEMALSESYEKML